MKVAVIGAGFAGLAAAHDLLKKGLDVTIYEAADGPGGLAAGFRDEQWSWPLEHFYHHLFTSDSAILGLARETGFGDRLITRRPITASWYQDGIYALDGVVPVLRFPLIPFLDRIRMGLVIGYLKVTRDWKKLERVTAVDWLRRWRGEPALEVIWRPLLVGKFGRHHDRIPMSWLWARLHKRSMRLMYFEGGFQAFADHLAAECLRLGARIHYGARVERVALIDQEEFTRQEPPVGTEAPAESDEQSGLAGHPRVTTPPAWTVRSGGQDHNFDLVIFTTGPHLLARTVESLPTEYLAGLGQLQHMGAIVVVLAITEQVLEKVYWLSMDKRVFPFLALVEHTNLIPPEHYGGDRLLYLGDYLEPDDPAFGLSDDELLAAWLPAVTKVNPAFDSSWVRKAWVFRTGYAQPVVPLGFSRHIPALATPLPGLYLASMSQVYPWDRGTNYAVEIGRKVAAEVTAGSVGGPKPL